ncbi:hypothetical protein IRZ71_22615 [Flavobacterium sp. ANB]|uniref:hypothetical protein n=1 Tax=unclassified Flavobacterium TaxID=196869 RepID=UPI0012B8A6EE|nr:MULTISPECIES: hypothetical protein [unclassified Flavobacterium]MBF4519157.1 hypothetical protein [Flavobacterium sp. ANB]MTD71643.1 hypothetical protein [Flavobacterium sp. LC2016-13]
MKFKLNRNDVKSLENSISLIENPVLKKAALDVTSAEHSGGNAPAWAKVDFAEIIWTQG